MIIFLNIRVSNIHGILVYLQGLLNGFLAHIEILLGVLLAFARITPCRGTSDDLRFVFFKKICKRKFQHAAYL